MEGVHAYYESALAAVRYVEHRAPTNRRFGADADLLWASSHGHLQAVDRIELLVRDADAQWPGSFGARGVLALDGAEDDAFRARVVGTRSGSRRGALEGRVRDAGAGDAERGARSLGSPRGGRRLLRRT